MGYILSSETLVRMYQATRRHTAEGNSVNSYYNENLWSQDFFSMTSLTHHARKILGEKVHSSAR
jgi:hypothetical protein